MEKKQRNEISSLFNALLLWDISICSAILRVQFKGVTKEGCREIWEEDEREVKGM